MGDIPRSSLQGASGGSEETLLRLPWCLVCGGINFGSGAGAFSCRGGVPIVRLDAVQGRLGSVPAGFAPMGPSGLCQGGAAARLSLLSDDVSSRVLATAAAK